MDCFDKKSSFQVKVASEETVAERGGKQFTKFRELVKIVGISQEIEDAGNVTMFAPRNRNFDNVTAILEDVELPTIRRWMRKHFIKGFLYRKNMEFGAVPVRIPPSFKNTNSL